MSETSGAVTQSCTMCGTPRQFTSFCDMCDTCSRCCNNHRNHFTPDQIARLGLEKASGQAKTARR